MSEKILAMDIGGKKIKLLSLLLIKIFGKVNKIKCLWI